MTGVDRPRGVHYTSAPCVLDTTSHLRGRPASRSSSNLGWKDAVRYGASLEAAWGKSGNSRRKHELRGDYPSEGHTCPGGTDSSWRCRTTHLDRPMLAPQRPHWGRFGSRTLSRRQNSSSKSAQSGYCSKMRFAAGSQAKSENATMRPSALPHHEGGRRLISLGDRTKQSGATKFMIFASPGNRFLNSKNGHKLALTSFASFAEHAN